VEEHQKLSALGFKKKNELETTSSGVCVLWDELPPRDPNEEEWNAEDYRRYRQWFEVYRAASAPLDPSDFVPPIPSAAEILDIGYIPHIPHRQRTVY
jgi:tRNA A37 N6-isopentenylltransferase MiaA